MSDFSEALFKRYALRFLAVLGLLIALVVLVNRLTDPYGIWPGPRIDGINAAKTQRNDQDYLFKPVDLMRNKPHTVFFGSSRSAYALSPDSKILEHQSLTPAYNGSLRYGGAPTTRAMLEHAIDQNDDLQTVVWAVDFFAFNGNIEQPAAFSTDRLKRSSLPVKDLVATHLSLFTLSESFKTVRDNWRGDPLEPYALNGQKKKPWVMENNVRRQGMKRRIEMSLELYLNFHYRDGNYGPDGIMVNEIKQFREIAQQHGIRLEVYVSPVHMSLFEAMHHRGLWDHYLEWLRYLAAEFDYWDYSLPNEINTETIDDSIQNFWDVSHCRAHVGERILADLFDSSSSSLGMRVTAENVDSYVEDVDNAFKQWRAKNPGVQQLVKNMAQ